MLNKFVDVLKEVFWLKTSTAKKQPRLRRGWAPAKTRKPSPKPALPAGRPAKVKPKPPRQVPFKPKKPAIDPDLIQAGEITHYFDRIKVCVVKITQGSILIGDRLTVKGSKTSFVQKVWSMQIENKDVKVARKGQLIGLKVERPVAVGDVVYK
ncbi:MAG: hypothetical protein HYZ86_00505 [Candidatus Omnitrophica bacterium]|nr:hypothetical protein [Candidatus Omnitrophota bacterium]